MDTGIGRLMDRLRTLGLDENTLVMFSSDNGPHREGGPNYAPDFFKASGPLRGIKRDLTEGGIRVPFIVRWPGRISSGLVSPHVGYFGDLLATFAERAAQLARLMDESHRPNTHWAFPLPTAATPAPCFRSDLHGERPSVIYSYYPHNPIHPCYPSIVVNS
jgi:arylsulfatase A-like enzyme